ncbi:hypothetical protein M405DRAFT_833135 [Rhizopogon salebrosus TDB-379]|nr:hypothetical protein M405DRAFT_833135 [Rhizopogon salebrosus TDB-379]
MDVSRDAAARHALERLERECLTIPRSHTVQTFPYGRSDTRTQPSDSTLTHPDRGTRATNKIHTLFEAHPRTALNNLLQIMYGISMSDHVRWEVSSTGVAISPIWHATVYINDMNYGRASAASKGAAMDIAALNAWNILRREIMAQDGAT